MRPERTKEFRVGEKYEWEDDLFRSEQGMWRGKRAQSLPSLSVPDAVRRLVQGLRRILVAFKYKGYQMTLGTSIKGISIPWWKIGLAVLTIFILTKKDIQFSLNLKAPITAIPRDDDQEASREGTALGMAQSIAFTENDESIARGTGITDAEVRDYVSRFSKVAIREMEEFGIPASIKMAQAILESDAGTSDYAVYENNFFGRPLADGQYENAWQNWRAHSKYLAEEHPALFSNGSSYKKWARGLKKSGYSTRRNYDQKLIQLVEKYQLYLLDEQ